MPASDLPSLPGLIRHPGGQDYAKWVAATLFGFADQQRLRTVVELLKTLRTPKLGNKLDPNWVIDRIREALPPLDTAEINELAEGWDQLGQLAQDRDDARDAQEAVSAYVRSTWNPWADGVLRRAADDLVAAVTVLDDVTRERSRAEQQAQKARFECATAEEAEQQNERERKAVASRRDTLLASQAYRAAADAGRQVTELTEKLKRGRDDERHASDAAEAARGTANHASADLEAAGVDLKTADEALASQIEVAGHSGADAGLPDALEWAVRHDSQRLLAGVRRRTEHVQHARRRAGKVKELTDRHELALERLADAQAAERERLQAHEAAKSAWENASQVLSDELEAWAFRVGRQEGVTAPPVALREHWLAIALTAFEQPRPAQTLGRLVRDDWLAPATEPVVAAAVTARNEAAAALARAKEHEAEAARAEAETVPIPADPRLWQRRPRPASGHGGAPLWELLDPLPGLSVDRLAGLEAALAGAGLLDAWVTPDGVWLPDRDGPEQVLILTGNFRNLAAEERSTSRLGTVLTLAEKARAGQPLAALAGTAQRVLDMIAWYPDTTPPRDAASVDVTRANLAVAGDGSWMTPTTVGRAIPSADGASLIGASAREAARARRVSALRDQAERERTVAAECVRAEEQHRALTERLTVLAKDAPDDLALVDAARMLTSAASELEGAQRVRRTRQHAEETAETAKDRAQADLVAYAAEHQLVVARLANTETALQAASLEAERLASRVAERDREQRGVDQKKILADRLGAAANDAEGRALEATSRRESLEVALQAAKDALEATDQELLAEAERLLLEIDELEVQRKSLNAQIRHLGGLVVQATETLKTAERKRREAEESRTEKLTAWWVPVDAGLSAARRLEIGEGARTLTAAVNQARTLRASRRPTRDWPDATVGAAGDKDRDKILTRLRDRLSGPDFNALNSTLNRTGGRTAIVEHDEETGLPQVRILVDSAGTTLEPTTAVRALEDKAAELGELHDEQMHEVMQELLSSTFVDHLRVKVKETEKLVNEVNAVLANHPTGATRTVVRLQRKQVPEHVGGFQVLQRLLSDGVDSPAVQQQVQAFLAGQIRAAQEEGHASGLDWKESLIDKLDYRNWFAVVTEWRVLASAKEGASQKWTELTASRHGQDSGGGKVMTMVQPLLATLATLYQTSSASPRPLWLDEAFDGLDPTNISSLLGMLVEFDFDFLLAGPKTLVASRQVPCAAVWIVNRAPNPLPGVDLGLWLFAAGTQERVPLAVQTWADDADPAFHGPADDVIEEGSSGSDAEDAGLKGTDGLFA